MDGDVQRRRIRSAPDTRTDRTGCCRPRPGERVLATCAPHGTWDTHFNRLRAKMKLDDRHLHHGWEDRMTPPPRNREAGSGAEPDHGGMGSCGRRAARVRPWPPVPGSRAEGGESRTGTGRRSIVVGLTHDRHLRPVASSGMKPVRTAAGDGSAQGLREQAAPSERCRWRWIGTSPSGTVPVASSTAARSSGHRRPGR